jgi:nucleoside-diphosphate kinase
MRKFLTSFLLSMTATVSLFAAHEQTLAIIKPDAVASNHIGDIIARLEKNGLRVEGLKLTRLHKAQAEKLYEIHKDRPFYNDLVAFMSSGPVVVIALEGENGVAKNREIIGATNPKDAAKGTIRADFASSVTQNAIHGSDSVENAKNEIAFFFTPDELFLTK